MKVAIFDIDNCIADDSRRIPLIDYSQRDPVARYDRYHSECSGDPAKNTEVVLEWAAAAERIVFMTSRPVKFRPQTKLWLLANVPGLEDKIKFSLLMRDNDDVRSSVEVKQAQLERLKGYGCKIPDDILAVFDDRKDILQMYRENGILNVNRLAIKQEEQEERALGAPGGPLIPAQLLRAAAKTFEQRNALYKNNYKNIGTALLFLFPDQTIPEIKNADDANRLNLIIDCLGKLQRYCYNFKQGGHKDSARDLTVYGSMLEGETHE